MTKSVYIHIPFCLSKCNYCAFVSFGDKLNFREQYFEALFKEIDCFYKGEMLKTLYIGGGTPSLIQTPLYKKMLKKFNFEIDAEITIEVNPATVNECYLASLRDIGINRISIGVQSFDENILKLIGRRHTVVEAFETIDAAKAAGFKNISIDLIYGLPQQTTVQWRKTVEMASQLDITHISTYGLKIEEGTRFFEHKPANLPDEDACAQMYLDCIEILGKKGFEQYEISNFSKSGYQSRHNTTYWRSEEYYGFGLAAHAYTEGKRYSKTTDFEQYLENPLKQENCKSLSTREKFEEAIFLGLRLVDGIDLKALCQKYNYNYADFEKTIKKFAASSHLEEQNGKLHFNKGGFLISDYILAELLNCIKV